MLIALQVLTNRKNSWRNPVVEFTIYEILKLMKLPSSSENLKRVSKSLDNWQGVRVKYSHWRVGNEWTNPEAFGFIQDYRLTRRGRALPEKPQVFTWSRIFFESVQDGKTKEFDSDFYFSLKLPMTRRLFRFLDKRLRMKSTYEYPLLRFCTEKIGMSRNYKKPSKYREKILPACKELENCGFLLESSSEKRFKDGKIHFARRELKSVKHKVKRETETHLCDLSNQLCSLGVSPDKAVNLVRDFSEEAVQHQIEHLKWLKENNKEPRNVGGWLRLAILNSWSPPSGFESQVIHEQKTKAKEQENRRIAEEAKFQKRQTELENRKRKELVNSKLQGFSDAELEDLFQEALACTSKLARKNYLEHQKAANQKQARRYRDIILERFVLDKKRFENFCRKKTRLNEANGNTSCF